MSQSERVKLKGFGSKDFSMLNICFRLGLVALAVAMLYAISPQQKLEAMLNILPFTMAGWQHIFMTLPFSEYRVSIPAYHFPGLLLILIFALFLLAPTGRRIIESLARNKKAAMAAVLSLGVFLFTLTPRPPVVGGEITWYTVVYLLWGSLSLGLLLHGVVPLAKVLNRRASCRRLLLNIWNGTKQILFESRPFYFLTALFVIFFTLTNLASYFLFEHIPHVMDSIAQVFHAKIFTLGKLVVPSPEHREFFALYGKAYTSTIINNGNWYSQYPPGHSFLLMLGLFINAPWLVNPLLGSLTVVLLYFLGKELYGETTGRLAALLATFSSFILFMSSEFMNHVSTMFFFVVFALCFAKTLHHKRIVHALVAGSALGMMCNIRPLTAAALAVPFCLFSCRLLAVRFREYVAPLAGMAAAALVFVAVLLSFNYKTNGDPFLFGYVALYGPDHLPGFGRAAWGEPHTPIQGLRYTLNDLNGLNKFLFEWPVPSLLFVFLLFASRTRNRWDYMLLAVFVSLVVTYFFYWYHDWILGPRYFYETAAALILLTARGILRLPMFLRDTLNLPISVRKAHAGISTFVASCFLIAACSNIPVLAKKYGNKYFNVNAKVLHAVEKKGIKKAIVFTRSYFGSVLPANSPLLDGEIIYARDLGEENRLLMAEYPDRTYYLAEDGNIQELQPAQ